VDGGRSAPRPEFSIIAAPLDGIMQRRQLPLILLWMTPLQHPSYLALDDATATPEHLGMIAAEFPIVGIGA
jgi:hypothetical protein